MAWGDCGDASYGGDSSAVQDQRKNVRHSERWSGCDLGWS